MKSQIVIQKTTTFSQNAPAFFDDQAIAHFRGFYELGMVYANKVRNPLAIDVMIAILDDIKNRLQKRRQMA